MVTRYRPDARREGRQGRRGQLGDLRPELTGDLAPLQASHFGVVLGEGGCDKDGDDNVLALMRFPNNHRPRSGGTRVAVLTR